jgi:type II secretory pathway pseudopilin PulG
MITRSQRALERKPSTPRTVSASRIRCSGVTTIELIAVLSIIAILAGIVAYSVMKRISLSSASAEELTLTTIADAYKTVMVRTRSIPNMTNWWVLVSDELSQSEAEVLKNRRGNDRLMLPHPQACASNIVGSTAFACNLAQDSSWQASPVFQQNANGVLSVANMKVVFVSSIGASLLNNGQPTDYIKTSGDLDKIWNTPKYSIPNTTKFMTLSNALGGGKTWRFCAWTWPRCSVAWF